MEKHTPLLHKSKYVYIVLFGNILQMLKPKTKQAPKG